MTNNPIQRFYAIDGSDYKFKRWERNPIARFDYNKTLHAIQKTLYNKKYNRGLEIGCGPGTWTGIIYQHCSNLVALDISDTMLDQAKAAYKDDPIKFILTDAVHFETKETFDFIGSIRAFEYIQDKQAFLKKCYDLLNPNGEFFIITKTKGSYWYGRSKIRNLLKKVLPVLFYYENKEADKEKSDENLTNFWQERLMVRKCRQFLSEAGFHDVKVRPVIMRPPIFMRGKSEIPLTPPFLEIPLLALFSFFEWCFHHFSWFTVFAESYKISGVKK